MLKLDLWSLESTKRTCAYEFENENTNLLIALSLLRVCNPNIVAYPRVLTLRSARTKTCAVYKYIRHLGSHFPLISSKLQYKAFIITIFSHL